MAIQFTQRFRRHVAPYDVVTSLRFLPGANYCPAMQTIRPDGNPSISRQTCPTVLVADLVASSSDDSGSVTSVTDNAVTNIKWFVQGATESAGTDITLHPSWTNSDFTIGTGNDKGRLTVKKNISAGGRWLVWMECDIADNRRGYTVDVHIATESVLLFSISDATPIYTMSVDRPAGEVYEPAWDWRLINEYKQSIGEGNLLADDGNGYLRTLTVKLRQEATLLNAGTDYTIQIFKVTSGGTVAANASNDDCIASVTGNEVTFDLRFAKSATYRICCFVGGNEVAHKNYGWVWSETMPTSDEGIITGATYINGKAQTCAVKLNLGAGLLAYPTVAFDMQWLSLVNGNENYVGSGQRATYDLTDSANFASGSSVCEASLKINRKAAFTEMKQGSDTLVDGSGNRYIEN